MSLNSLEYILPTRALKLSPTSHPQILQNNNKARYYMTRVRSGMYCLDMVGMMIMIPKLDSCFKKVAQKVVSTSKRDGSDTVF